MRASAGLLCQGLSCCVASTCRSKATAACARIQSLVRTRQRRRYRKPSLKWIQAHVSRTRAAIIIRTTTGETRKNRWTVETPARPMLPEASSTELLAIATKAFKKMGWVGRQPVTALHSLLSTATHMCRFFVANLQRRSPGAAAETCRSRNPHSSPPTFALKMWHFLHK